MIKTNVNTHIYTHIYINIYIYIFGCAGSLLLQERSFSYCMRDLSV